MTNLETEGVFEGPGFEDTVCRKGADVPGVGDSQSQFCSEELVCLCSYPVQDGSPQTHAGRLS